MFTINLSKTLSLFLSLALMTSSMPVSAAPVASAPMPDFVKALTPSENLGFVDSYYKGNTDRPVILIQDLHANYGVQKKIAGLLEFLQPKVAPTGRSMVVGIEGAWGDVDLSIARSAAEKVRRPVLDYLLQESEISGMEHFAALSQNEVQLKGIDDPEDYIVHNQLFRKSLAARLSLAKKTDQLREVISESKGKGSRSLRQLWRLEESFHAGQVDLGSLSKKLNTPIANYKEAEKAFDRAKVDLLAKEEGEKAYFLKNVVEADKNLSLLGRLLRQQLTLEEVSYAGKQIPAMLLTVRALLPGENIKLWEDTIRTAMDHYAVALLRDKPMGDHALALSQNHPDNSIVVVTGGFHTAGISNFLKARKVSHIVIAPVVESHTSKDEEVYVQRMLDIHISDAQIASSLKISKAVSSISMLTFFTSRLKGAVQIAPHGASMLPRIFTGIAAAGVLAVGAANLQPVSVRDVNNAKEINRLMQPSDISTPGPIENGINRLRELTGTVEETVADEPSSAPTAVEVPLAAEAPATAKTGKASNAASTRSTSSRFSATKISAIFGAVSLAGLANAAAQSPAGQKAVMAAVDSSALQQAGVGADPVTAILAIGGTMAAIWAANKLRKKRLEQIRQDQFDMSA